MDCDINETAFHRACKDTRFYFSTIRFWIFELLITTGFTIWVLLWTPNFVEGWQKIMYQILVPMLGAIGGLFIVFLFSFVVAPIKQRNEARICLSKMVGDNISQTISQLNLFKTKIDGEERNYTSILMKCAGDLSVGGITIEPDRPSGSHNWDTGAWEENILSNDMTHSQLLGFLRQLRIAGIVDVDRNIIGRDTERSVYLESFYLNEFGRQVVNRIKPII